MYVASRTGRTVATGTEVWSVARIMTGVVTGIIAWSVVRSIVRSVTRPIARIMSGAIAVIAVRAHGAGIRACGSVGRGARTAL